MPLLEWFANNYKKFGATLEIVTDKSQEGSQFVKGFGGIGGKWRIQLYWIWCLINIEICMYKVIVHYINSTSPKEFSTKLIGSFSKTDNGLSRP